MCKVEERFSHVPCVRWKRDSAIHVEENEEEFTLFLHRVSPCSKCVRKLALRTGTMRTGTTKRELGREERQATYVKTALKLLQEETSRCTQKMAYKSQDGDRFAQELLEEAVY